MRRAVAGVPGKEEERGEGGQKERRERPVSSVSRRAVRSGSTASPTAGSETLICFFTRDEKKKTRRSQPPRLATAATDVTAEGKPGALYPLAAGHGHQPSK